MGKCQEKLGRYEDALKSHQLALISFEKNLPSFPLFEDFGTIFYNSNTGRCLKKLGQHNEAMQLFKKAFTPVLNAYAKKNYYSFAYHLENFLSLLNRSSDKGHCQSIIQELIPLAENTFGPNDPIVIAMKKGKACV